MADERERLLLDTGFPLSFFDLNNVQCSIGIKELSTIDSARLNEILQLTNLSEGFVWNSQKIYDAIVEWRQRNQVELQQLLECENNQASFAPWIVPNRIVNEPRQALDHIPVEEENVFGSTQSSDSQEGNTEHTVETHIYHPRDSPSSLASNIFLRDITNTGQRLSNHDTAGCSGLGTVVDENTVGRKLFSPTVLMRLLNSSELGKDIVRRSEVGELSSGRKYELVGIIAEWHLANRTRLLQEDLQEYAVTVTSVFKSENKVIATCIEPLKKIIFEAIQIQVRRGKRVWRMSTVHIFHIFFK